MNDSDELVHALRDLIDILDGIDKCKKTCAIDCAESDVCSHGPRLAVARSRARSLLARRASKPS